MCFSIREECGSRYSRLKEKRHQAFPTSGNEQPVLDGTTYVQSLWRGGKHWVTAMMRPGCFTDRMWFGPDAILHSPWIEIRDWPLLLSGWLIEAKKVDTIWAAASRQAIINSFWSTNVTLVLQCNVVGVTQFDLLRNSFHPSLLLRTGRLSWNTKHWPHADPPPANFSS